MTDSEALNPDRTSLLEVGERCTHSSCLLIDFLPFKCQHCKQPFCGDHFLPTAHNCEKYNAAEHDRVAPSCPLCNTPVAIPLGEDPNIRMDCHIRSECPVIMERAGQAKAKATPRCAHAKCKKVLYSPICCESCGSEFCPQHRFPNDHSCSAPSAKASEYHKSWSKPNRTNAATAAAVAAINRATAVVQGSDASKRASGSKSAGSASGSNPFSANDRRAKAERDSRRKAILERRKKGIAPSEEELAFLRAEEDRGKGDCLVM